MVRAGKIISQWLGTVFSDKDRSRISDLCHHIIGILCLDLQVLGCDLVGRLDRLLHRIRYQDVAVIIKRLPNDFRPG